MTPHSAHHSSLLSSYRHCIVHTANGFPLSVARQGTLSSDSFHVPDVSLVPDPTMLGRSLTMTVVLFLTLMFAIFRIIALITWLALAPVIVIHSVFGILTDFSFLSLHPPVLSAPPVLLRLHHHLLSGIIVWVIFLTPNYLLCFVEVF
jgi:hypothetical protein